MTLVQISGSKDLKHKFELRYKKLLGEKYSEYLRYSFSFLTRSIRINTLKITIPKLRSRLKVLGWTTVPIPWCAEGYWVEHKTGRLDIGNTLEHALGYYYVQEAASMIPPIVLNPKPGDLVFDMCASPGSKTTQIAQYMKHQGVIVANDFATPRMSPLSMNLQRIGVRNAIITKMYGQWFVKKSIIFDKILVDAPCSGTGTIRKSLKTISIWNPIMIKRLSATQKKLICSAFEILKPKGVLVYSTCSTEPEENEEVVSHLLSRYDNAIIEPIKLNLKSSNPITSFEDKEYNPETKKCLRLWPQDNNTEGFFVAKILKA